ncbi:MAG TPA: asparagine synthase (glutamine-hydrolyzing) [Blastocatellia bacterium]|nr:asparagine synthase (glutamine-hydrolyzing) [Blastocatellia bacterium]
MCGIAGIAHSSSQPVDEAALHRMCDAMIHRGPDEEGYYFNKTDDGSYGVGLGIRRLSIIDLETGSQPIHNEDGSVWVVLNGEIYNYPELRSHLESLGHSFYTRSDTEAIVHAYEQYGLDAPKHLRGMFAFALWDENNQRLVLARDRLGKKPLLYSIKNGKLIFASEFQAMLEHTEVSRDINREALSLYLSFMCVPAPATAFADIKKLMPAHMLVWEKGSATILRYWSPDFTKKIAISEQEAAEQTISLLSDAVKVRLMSDVPLGAFLSGGVDSSAVVALMSELSPARVKTFSIGFEEQDYSELSHARRVAERFDTDHHEFVVRPDALEVLPTLVRHYGEPYADSSAIPTYYLSKLARQHVTVALNGDGGDESFAGYERYAAMRIAERYQRLPAFLRKQVVEPALGAIPAPSSSRSRSGRARRFVTAMGLPRAERYLSLTAAIGDELKGQLCTREFLDQTTEAKAINGLNAWFVGNGEVDVVDRAMMADTAHYLPNDLLVKVDIASMANSLEARSPFLDHNVIEFAASLPAQYKLRGLATKRLLKRALRGLVPHENLTRSKQGFGVPIGEWFRGKLKGFLEETILSQRALRRNYFNASAVRNLFEQHTEGRRDFSHQLWTLLMLELWHQQFID